jgi:hypothetical protein
MTKAFAANEAACLDKLDRAKEAAAVRKRFGIVGPAQ